MEVKFQDGSIGNIPDAAFNWMAKISPSKYNSEYWNWIESLNHEKIVVEMNRFKWTLYRAWPVSDVLQQNDKELFVCLSESEFNMIKDCRNENVDICGREEG